MDEIKQYGLLGQTLKHSYSPQIHKALGNPHYQLYEKEPGELADFLHSGNFNGLNITIPYKQTVMPFCSQLSPAAQAAGSVNTIVRLSDGSLYGDNTDTDGFRAMLDSENIKVQGKKVLILGNGGAHAAVDYVCRQMGASSIITISRQGPNHYQNLFLHADAQIVVNTTPVGMYPSTGKSPVSLDLFPQCEAVLDVIYNPFRTQLLMDAEAHGIPCCGGLLMLVAQARESVQRWNPHSVFPYSDKEILQHLQAQMNNIIFIGMPGSGKTTIAEKTARQLHRPFIDTDQEIIRRIHMPIPEFFARFGEEAFRQQETLVLEEFGKQSGLVISTGGGCVTRVENYPLLHQNGIIIFLQRNLKELDKSNRPLSLQGNLKEMYQKRLPMYEKFSDVSIQNSASIMQAVKLVQEVFYEIISH